MAAIKPLRVWRRLLAARLNRMPKPAQPAPSSALQALTVAALALPGLVMPGASFAESDEVDFQYGHYQEGKRNLYGVSDHKNPIEVDSLLGKANISLTDRIKFAFNYVQDTWSGATPVTTTPLLANSNRPIQADTASGQTITVGASPLLNSQIVLNKQWVPVWLKPNNKIGGENAQVVHTLSMASPETRKQGDFKLGYQWEDSALDIGGGISIENDYESRFGNINWRQDFNQKLTTLNVGVSYTNSDTSAILDHDASPYITKTAFADQIEQDGALKILHGDREDWAATLGVTQVLSKRALLETSAGFTHSTGYMENPYKATTIVFVDPDQQGKQRIGNVQAFLEQRPDERNQFSMGSRYVQHIDFTDAALHLGYRFFHDDWDINAHTFEADWVQPLGVSWTVTPRVRYYSQDAAFFYAPYWLSKQAFSKLLYDEATGVFTPVSYDPGKLPTQFSSDQRLSGFGALSGGVTVSKQFSKAIGLEAGFEYYRHAGDLKLDGGGEGRYSDFDYFMANATLKVNLSALAPATASEQAHHHAGHHAAHGAPAPAGVMFEHLMGSAGDSMVGYRYMYSRQAGSMLHGDAIASDLDIVNNGCGVRSQRCRLTPTYMDMHMHMLDLMYAPTDWLNLMLMPQFMDMAMNLRELDGAPPVPPGGHIHTGTGHATGGIGDTGLYALFKLFDASRHHVHFALGLSAPTGDVDIKLRRTHQQDEGYIHYGMQLGSGTWDFKPSLTYTGREGAWVWGAQLSGTHRLHSRNESGFAFGDLFQSTAWGGYQPTQWLTVSVRGVYTEQQAIDGQFDPVSGVVNGRVVDDVNAYSGPMDYPGSYGGRYWDIGFGVNAVIPSGEFAGHRFGVEWLQPVGTDVNGYQLDREGALSAVWGVGF